MDDEEKGNLLFLDIKNAANSFAQRQATMNDKLTATLKEKRALASGKISESAQKDAIKRRVSAQVMDGGDDSVGGLDMNEINRLRQLHGQGPPPHTNGPMGNSLMIPGMEMGPPPDITDDDEKEFNQQNYGLSGPQINRQEQPQTITAITEEEEDENQDIDIQQQPEPEQQEQPQQPE
eukprot:359698_1